MLYGIKTPVGDGEFTKCKICAGYHCQRLKKRKKKADYLHRTATTAYPCYLPVLGGFSRSWSCKTCRLQRYILSTNYWSL